MVGRGGPLCVICSSLRSFDLGARVRVKRTRRWRDAMRQSEQERTSPEDVSAAITPGGEADVQTLLVVHDAERAIAFYADVFGAREVWRVMHWHRVGHAVLRIG